MKKFREPILIFLRKDQRSYCTTLVKINLHSAQREKSSISQQITSSCSSSSAIPRELVDVAVDPDTVLVLQVGGGPDDRVSRLLTLLSVVVEGVREQHHREGLPHYVVVAAAADLGDGADLQGSINTVRTLDEFLGPYTQYGL